MADLDGYVGNFRMRGAQIEFVALCALSFLCCLAPGMLVYLPRILLEGGFSDSEIGIVVFAAAAPLIAASLGSGILVGKTGTRPLLVGALSLVLVSVFTLHYTSHSLPLVIGSRMLFGAGMGFVIPVGMVHAKYLLSSRRFVYFFGIYSSMFTLPNVVGPWLADIYLSHFGAETFFYAVCVPIAFALALCIRLGNALGTTSVEGRRSYVQLLTEPRLREPYLYAFGFGMIWGFPLTFMTILLAPSAISAAYFFSSSTITLLLVRFLILGYLETLPRPFVVSLGFAASSLAYGLLVVSVTAAIVVAAGVLAGTGHALVYPNLSAWISERFAPADRGRPVALFNVTFNAGAYIFPLAGGVVLGALGMETLLIAVAVIGLALTCLMAMSRSTTAIRARWQSSASAPPSAGSELGD